MKIRTLIIVLLLLIAVFNTFNVTAGVDFYQFWGVGKAQALSGYKLTSPYAESDEYASILANYTAQSSNIRMRVANNYRRGALDLTSTPLFYALLATLPQNYTVAFGIYRTLLTLAFIASVVLLAAHSSLGEDWTWVLAVLLACIYYPFQSDLRVGNCGSFELFLLVLLALFAEHALIRSRRKPGAVAILLCGLIFVTLLKPNVALVTLFLAADVWVLSGTGVFAPAVAIGIAFAVAMGAVTSLKFGSWWVWLDWYRYLRTYDSARLAALGGNYSTVLLLARGINSSASAVIIGLAGGMILSAGGATLLSLPSTERGWEGLRRAAARALGDPLLCAAGGVVVTLALAPLMWIHYYVLSLLPAVWLLSKHGSRKYAGAAGGLSIVLSANGLVPLLVLCGLPRGVEAYEIAVSWVPLWVGVLAVLRGLME